MPWREGVYLGHDLGGRPLKVATKLVGFPLLGPASDQADAVVNAGQPHRAFAVQQDVLGPNVPEHPHARTHAHGRQGPGGQWKGVGGGAGAGAGPGGVRVGGCGWAGRGCCEWVWC